jgi:hypothetical protein
MSDKIIIKDNDLWARAVLASKDFDVEDEALLTEKIYTNLGGRFSSKEEEDKETEKKGEKVSFDDKHTSPETGKKLKKLSDEEDDSRTPEGWSKYIDEETQYSRDFRDGSPIYQARRKQVAQQLGTTDPTVAEPNIESDANQSQNIGNPDIIGDETPTKGLVDKETDTELRGDKLDNHDVIDAVKDFLTILLVHTDFTSEDILSELKSLFDSDELYNEFKGKLDEAISDKQEDKPVDEQTAQEFLDVMDSEGETMPQTNQTPSAGIVSAILKKAPKKAVLYKKQANKLLSDLREVSEELKETKNINVKLAQDNEKLKIERSIRMRYPFSKALATKMYHIGELGHEGEKQELIARKADQLVLLPDNEFNQIESRVEQVFDHVGNQGNSIQDILGEGESIISYVPNHVTATSRQMEFGKEKEENNKNNSRFQWSTPSQRA